MGADRLLVVSTHFEGIGATISPARAPRDGNEEQESPSPATILAAMYDSMFLDQLDQDIRSLDRTNQLLKHVAEPHRDGLREIDLLVIEPSENLGALAFDLQDRIPPTFRYLLHQLGSGQPGSDDFLSTMMFHPDYVRRLIEIGERDGRARAEEIAAFIGRGQ